jgi:HAD superfamily hydrolase (TIGR01549 family)
MSVSPGRANGIDPRVGDIAGALEVILFDLDGTLRVNRPSYVQAFYDCAVRLGAEGGPEQRRAAARWAHYYWAESPDLKQDQRLYLAGSDPFWLNYALRSLLAFGCSEECASQLAPQVNDYMQNEHRSENWVPPDVPETLQALKDRGYRLGLLSNRDRPCQEQLAALALLDYFDLTLTAGEVGAWKPDPLIFTQALQQMECQASQAVYIGDNYYADVIGAQRAGVLAVLLDPDGIFPDADCPIIGRIGDLQDWLPTSPPIAAR